MARKWRIVITGEGPSLNERPDDADAIARDFLKYLVSEKHKITSAVLQEDGGKNHPLLSESKEPKVTDKPLPVPANLRTADGNVSLVTPGPPDGGPPKDLGPLREQVKANLIATYTDAEAADMIKNAGEDEGALNKLLGKKKQRRNAGDGQP